MAWFGTVLPITPLNQSVYRWPFPGGGCVNMVTGLVSPPLSTDGRVTLKAAYASDILIKLQ